MKITYIKKAMFDNVVREVFGGGIIFKNEIETFDGKPEWTIKWTGNSQRDAADARTFAGMLEKAATILDYLNENEMEVDFSMTERTFTGEEEKAIAKREAGELIEKNYVRSGLNVIFNM